MPKGWPASCCTLTAAICSLQAVRYDLIPEIICSEIVLAFLCILTLGSCTLGSYHILAAKTTVKTTALAFLKPYAICEQSDRAYGYEGTRML